MLCFKFIFHEYRQHWDYRSQHKWKYRFHIQTSKCSSYKIFRFVWLGHIFPIPDKTVHKKHHEKQPIRFDDLPWSWFRLRSAPLADELLFRFHRPIDRRNHHTEAADLKLILPFIGTEIPFLQPFQSCIRHLIVCDNFQCVAGGRTPVKLHICYLFNNYSGEETCRKGNVCGHHASHSWNTELCRKYFCRFSSPPILKIK